jgi:arylsulfatase A-like enzyme
LSEDLAGMAITWLRKHRAYASDQPFFMYWAPGASHGPHHIFKEWADKYKGQFDQGWDALRESTFRRQKELGWIPASAQLTPRDSTMESWDAIPASQRAFQTRLMEIFAGFTEHVDMQAGKVIDELERLGVRENTIVMYIFGDNGSSAEGQRGTISELLAQNNIPNTIEEQLAALKELGGLDALGGPKTDNMYHAGWAWAGSTPFKGTKLLGSYFGGTRNPLVISWPKGIRADAVPRAQFHHVNDIAPTLYSILGITAPKVVDGFTQDPIDGVSMKYTFADAGIPSQKQTQYFDNNGSRGIYHEGWYAGTMGPFIPWDTPGSVHRVNAWDANKDVWELYDLRSDFSQANDLARSQPAKLAEMKALFLDVAKENKAFPIGAGLWLRTHPGDRVTTPYTSWTFDASTVRMPEFAAPGLGRASNRVVIDADISDKATGVLYALGGFSGGLTLFMDKGELAYEYNMLQIERTSIKARDHLAAGRHSIQVDTVIAKPGGPADIVLSIDGKEVGRGTVKRTVPAAFTASESFDVGVDLGSPVSFHYFNRRPFKFDGRIDRIKVEMSPTGHIGRALQ